jgi:hypothetical protein
MGDSLWRRRNFETEKTCTETQEAKTKVQVGGDVRTLLQKARNDDVTWQRMIGVRGRERIG